MSLDPLRSDLGQFAASGLPAERFHVILCFRLKLKPITASAPQDLGSELVIGLAVLLSVHPHQQRLETGATPGRSRRCEDSQDGTVKRPRHRDSDDKRSEVKYLTCLPVLIRQRQRCLMHRLWVLSEHPLCVSLQHIRRPSGRTSVSFNLASAQLLLSSWCISPCVCVCAYYYYFLTKVIYWTIFHQHAHSQHPVPPPSPHLSSGVFPFEPICDLTQRSSGVLISWVGEGAYSRRKEKNPLNSWWDCNAAACTGLFANLFIHLCFFCV